MAFILFLFLIFSPITLFAQPNQKNISTKQSTIVEADGYSYLSEDKTIKQIRQESLSNAKRDALEKGQTYLKSYTKVENFQLTYDLVQSESEGYVKIIESKDNGITSDNRYHYWIKAEIEYVIKVSKSEKTKNNTFLMNPSAPLAVMVWTEKSIYNKGEKIRIFLQGNKDFYARLIYVDVKENILQLIPNQYRINNYFKGGKVFSIPKSSDNFELEVSPPFGKEKIIVYASSSPQGNVETTPLGKSLFNIKSDLETIGKKPEES